MSNHCLLFTAIIQDNLRWLAPPV